VEPLETDPDAQRISDQSKWGGDRLSQQNVGDIRHSSARKFTGQMDPSALHPTQEFVSSSRVENLRHAIKSAGITNPVSVEYTHEIGNEGNPVALLGHGHHRRQAAFAEGMKVPVEGFAHHGYDAPPGTRFVDE
jgi:hypothetical protein